MLSICKATIAVNRSLKGFKSTGTGCKRYRFSLVSFMQVKPYLPVEWTPKGMLERVNAFTENYVSAKSAVNAKKCLG